MDIDEIQAKVDDLSRRYTVASNKRRELSGLLQGKKQELANLSQEIRKAGFDPKKLAETRDQLKQEVETQIAEFEEKLVVMEAALANYDKQAAAAAAEA